VLRSGESDDFDAAERASQDQSHIGPNWEVGGEPGEEGFEVNYVMRHG
jgi:hypothetical protein